VKITPEYLEQNRRLHEVGNYGLSGQKYAPFVLAVSGMVASRDILDYGCGQRTLERTLGFEIRNYDPCIPGLDAPPQPADVVVCTDVLEHVEPDCLEDVLDDLQRLTRKVALLVIANRPAKKVLPDGRNAHLIQQPSSWWRPRLERRFRIAELTEMDGEFGVVVVPLGG
jgi:hypothetical protein